MKILDNKNFHQTKYIFEVYFFLMIVSIINFFNLDDKLTVILLTSLTILYLILEFKKNYTLILFGVLLMLEIGGLNRFLIENYGNSLINILIQFVLLGVFFLKQKKISIPLYIVQLLVIFNLFILIYIVLGSINSTPEDIYNFIKTFISNSVILYITIIILITTSKKNIKILFNTLLIFFSSIIIFQWSNSINEYDLNEYFVRGTGLLGNANIAGVTILIFLLLHFYKLAINISFYDTLIFLLAFYALVLTQSRSSLLIFLIIALIILINFDNNFLKKSIKTTVFLSLIFSLFFWLVKIYPSFFLKMNLSDQNFDNSRIDALKLGLESITHSLFGIGIGQTSENILSLSSHNFYIHMLSETGIFILPVAVVFIITTFYKITYHGSFNNISNYLLIFILLICIFTHSVLVNSVYYFLLGIIFILSYKERALND